MLFYFQSAASLFTFTTIQLPDSWPTVRVTFYGNQPDFFCINTNAMQKGGQYNFSSNQLSLWFYLFQVMFWSQQISFWLIGIMVVTSIRGLLITLTKVLSFLYSLANTMRVSEKMVSGVVLSYSLVYTIQA